MADTRLTQSTLLAAVQSGGGDVRLPKVSVLVAAQPPAEFTYSTGVSLQASVQYGPTEVRLAQTRVLAAVRGRIENPKITAWTFTLDGHDYYVLRLGMQETLVYDVSAQEWYNWGSGDEALWEPQVGLNWVGGLKLGGSFSNIIVGGDINGSIYFLDPDGDQDDHPIAGGDPTSFERLVTGFALTPRGYKIVPCHRVKLFGSIGQSDSTETTVSISYSDDRGRTYTDEDSLDIVASEYSTRVNWLSLGSMKAPGRIFRIKDTGALKRIDSLELKGTQ